MGKKFWIISISMATTMVALVVLVVGSYSLFTGDLKLKNHLEAGELKLELYRTGLTWNEINDEGFLEEYEDDELINVKDLENIFDSSTTNSKYFIPGSYYEANMRLVNAGDVAFDYYIEIILKGEVNKLSEQLEITFIMNDTVITKKLSEGLLLGSSAEPIGQSLTEGILDFKLKIEFINGNNNNEAQSLDADFDFIVYAVQSISKN